MSSILVYYVHPGQRHSMANRAMQAQLATLPDAITRVDLYREYPRHDIRIDIEQQRLLDHQYIVVQFPLFWYSTPSLLKEWMDLVLEYGFAYGPGGDKLAGKTLLLAITAGASDTDYHEQGRHRHSIRTLLSPLEQTVRLCQMDFASPYIFFNSLSSDNAAAIENHSLGYRKLLDALHQDRITPGQLQELPYITANNIEQMVKST